MQAIIIDDEKHCRQVLHILLTKYCPDIEVVAQCANGKTALQAVEEFKPDIIFLDIEMPGMNGFEFLEQCKQKDFAIIFTTAYNEYAIQAIRNTALDYLLKPIDIEELIAAVKKCKKRFAESTEYPDSIKKLLNKVLTSDKPAHKERFLVQVRNKWIPIDVAKIAIFNKEFINYLTTFSGEKFHLNQGSLEDIEEDLDEKMFFRANRQQLINIHAIENVVLLEDASLIIQLKEPLNVQVEVSKKKAAAFKKWLVQ